ncbi:MAG: hypothetical protein LUF27_12565 [Lachnospiraceae bacterium]|nr:hypothetical protein [Lachnospiraceae bacterium]
MSKRNNSSQKDFPLSDCTQGSPIAQRFYMGELACHRPSEGGVSRQAETLPEKNTASDTNNQNNIDSVTHTEDAVMKLMMEFFSEEMLPVFGITQKATAFTLTEEIHLELKKGYLDFNLIMEDGSVSHFEFQSTNGGKKDLRRFQTYESNLSYILQKPVTTYVLFSGKIKRPMTHLKEGINTYRIHPVIMSQRNADLLLEELRSKVSRGEALIREDLVRLPLLPTFGGKSSQLERIQTAFELTTKAEEVSKEDVEKIEAAIYAMATKFLNHNELKQIKGGLKMTYLGQLLFEDGREEGRKEEQKNTERERQRAEKAEMDAKKAKADAQKALAELSELKKQLGLC